jgi:hypothetical protein
MDTPQYSTLLEALQNVPDPRKARGKRYGWQLLLTIIVAGLASNTKRLGRLPTGRASKLRRCAQLCPT